MNELPALPDSGRSPSNIHTDVDLELIPIPSSVLQRLG